MKKKNFAIGSKPRRTARALPVSDARPGPSGRPDGDHAVLGAKSEQAARLISEESPNAESLRHLPNCELSLAAYNVNTLMKIGSQALLAKTLSRRKVSVACLAEVRIPNDGSRTIVVPAEDPANPPERPESYELYHSGPTDGSGLYGVGFALNQKARAALLAWEPVSPRLARIRLKAGPMNITIIAIYAPTEVSAEADKDAFYEELRALMARVPRKDLLFVAGDFNAHLGRPAASERRLTGKYTLDLRNGNGDRLVQLLADYNLVAANTLFQHKRRHLETWVSPGGRYRSQIDYILVPQRWRASLVDARSYWGTDLKSDHALVVCKFKLKLRTVPKIRPEKRFDVDKLKNEEIRAEYEEKLAAQAEEVWNEPNVQKVWDIFQDQIKTAAEEVVGFRVRPRKSWLSADTMELLNQRLEAANSAGVRAFEISGQLQKDLDASMRRDLHDLWDRRAESMEAAASVNDMRKLFQLMRRAAGKSSSAISETIKDISGNTICDLEDRTARWAEHFNLLLNRPPPADPLPEDAAGFAFLAEISDEEPSIEEVQAAIMKLKNNKAPGEDNISPEMLKKGGPPVVLALTHLYGLIWRDFYIPEGWETAILLPFFKKGDKSICKNYRGISLLDLSFKCLEAVISNRIREACELAARENQAGFRAGRGCVDQIFALRQVIELHHEFREPLFIAFIDFAAAFDSIDRRSLRLILEALGFPTKIIKVIMALYNETKCRVRVYGQESKPFTVTTGVRQGAILSPTLFNICIDWAMREALDNQDLGIQLTSMRNQLTDLDYADDIAILARTPQELQLMVDRVAAAASRLGLCINAAKTKVMAVATADVPQISVAGEILGVVQTFTYLGSNISAEGNGSVEIRTRIAKARSAFGLLNRCVWRERRISLKTKERLYDACIRSVLLYGCETWPMKKDDLDRLSAFEHICWRRILRIPYTAHVENETVRKRFHHEELTEHLLQKRRLRWLGHALRMPDERLPKATLMANGLPGWKRPLGRPRKTWQRTVQVDDLTKFERKFSRKSWKADWRQHCETAAHDRSRWRQIIALNSSPQHHMQARNRGHATN